MRALLLCLATTACSVEMPIPDVQYAYAAAIAEPMRQAQTEIEPEGSARRWRSEGGEVLVKVTLASDGSYAGARTEMTVKDLLVGKIGMRNYKVRVTGTFRLDHAAATTGRATGSATYAGLDTPSRQFEASNWDLSYEAFSPLKGTGRFTLNDVDYDFADVDGN